MHLRALLLTVMVSVCMCAIAAGEPEARVKYAPSNMPEGHAWLVLSGARAGEFASVLHVPPRGAGQADRGVATPAMELSQAPVRVSAWDDRLYLGFGREGGDAKTLGADMWQWRVQRIRAERFGRSWAYPPGRPEALTPLSMRWGEKSSEPFLAALAAGSDDVAAVLAVRDRGGEDSTPRGVQWVGAELRLFSGRNWQLANLPWQSGREDAEAAPSPTGRVLLAGRRGGWAIASVEARAGEMRLWIGEPERLAPGVVGPPEAVRWAGKTIALPETWSTPKSMLGVPGQNATSDGLVLVWTPERLVRIGVIEGLRVREVGTFATGAEPVVGVQPGAEGGSACAAMMWVESALDQRATTSTTTPTNTPATKTSETSDADPFARKVMLREVSLETGRELYLGGARMGLTLVTRQYQFIAGGLVVVMIVVMLFVLRPDRPTLSPAALPEGTVQAGALRRGLAAMIDLSLGAALAGLLLGVPMAALLDVRLYLVGELGWQAWGATVGLTALLCTVGEGLSGHSVGKLITGCMVVSVRQGMGGMGGVGGVGPGRAVLWQALVRNVIRWALPPLGVLVLLDRDGRHPGDLAAGTAVVTEQPGPPDADEE